MNFDFKKFTILSLVLAVFFSLISCCCLTDLAQAEQSVFSCHQTDHANDASENTNDCDCDQTLTIFEKDFEKTTSVKIVSLIVFDDRTRDKLSSSIIKTAYYIPPIIYNSTPLYIKHSVLRI